MTEVLFAEFHNQLASLGYVAREGQMIDATFVEVPKQRNTREENKQIKTGELGTKTRKKPLQSVVKKTLMRVGQRKIHKVIMATKITSMPTKNTN